MGTCKATLPFQGERLMDRVARLSEQAGCVPHFVIKRTQKIHSIRHQVVLESAEQHHPLLGVACALAHCNHQYALILPCDTPFLQPASLKQLCVQQRPTVVYSEHIHPLIGWYPTSWSKKAAVLANTNQAAAKFAKDAFYLYLPHEELRNCNRPEDL